MRLNVWERSVKPISRVDRSNVGQRESTRRPRRGVLLAGGAALVAACARSQAETLETLRPKVVEGPPRPYLLVEVTRTARTADGTTPSDVEACRWHVNQEGALYGDHWGWCEDFAILPASSPGYLIATTLYTGGTRGGAATMYVLPPLPAEVPVFGHLLRLSASGTTVTLEFEGQPVQLEPRRPVDLGRERATVEAPRDTGHFEPGGDQPITADVTYSAIGYGWLESRKIAGRG